MPTKRSTKVNSTAPSPETSLFWDELAVDMLDPEFQREFELESLRIATIDSIIGALDAAREDLAMSKADVARAIGGQGSAVRRLFSSDSVSPTLTSITEVAAAVGMRIVAVPMDPREQQRVLSVMSKAPTGAQSVPRAAGSRARTTQRAVPQRAASSTKAAAGRSTTGAGKTVAKKSVAAKKTSARSVR
jgi:DNA-binding phage protein